MTREKTVDLLRTTIRRVALGATAAATAAAMAGCGDNVAGVPDRAAFEFTLSEPRQAGLGGPAVVESGTPARLIGGGVVFVSLQPGTVTDGRTATIRNVTTGYTVVAAVVNGGFDPLPVIAAVDDSIEVVVTDGAGEERLAALRVPLRRPPIVVRTVPPRGGTDIPVNLRAVVVFSEPMDPRTITTASLQLRQGATPVAARVMLSADGLSAEIVPDSPLALTTSYNLLLTTVVADLSGDLIGASVAVPFVTASTAPVPIVDSVAVEPASLLIHVGEYWWISARVWDTDGRELFGQAVAWTSSAPSVATVTALADSGGLNMRGLINAHSGGTAVITATVGGVSGAATVTVAPSAVVRVTTVTTGADPDATGYSLPVLGAYFVTPSIDANATILVPVPPGAYRVRLNDVAVNCEVVGENPRTVSLVGGDTVDVDFAVTCATAGQLVIVRDVNEDPDVEDLELFLVKVNGTGLTRLTVQPGRELSPAWSPDGARIAFATDRDGDFEIYTMNADGSGIVRLTTSAGTDYRPVYSPDGSRIAFWSARDGNANIYAMDVDGSNLVRLTDHAAADVDPAWAPDGTRLAFVSDRDGNPEVYLMNADGSGIVRTTFTAEAELEPDWSPDGATLSYLRGPNCATWTACWYEFWTMQPDGSGGARLNLSQSLFESESPFSVSDPGWSPDSRWIVFTWQTCYWCNGQAVFVARRDGSWADFVIDNGFQPAWRP